MQLMWEYFASEAGTKCPRCEKEFSLWASIESAIEHEVTPIVYGLTGAWTIGFGFDFEPGEKYMIDLESSGLPPDVRIVSRQYSEGDGFRIVEAIGYQPGGWTFPPKYKLLTVPHPSFAQAPDVMVVVTFIDEASLSGAARQFFLACDLLLHHEVSGLVAVAAHSAIELAVEETIARYAAQSVTEAQALKFAEGLREADAVKVMAPILADSLGVPAMKDHIRGSLDTLRRARNAAAHRGEAIARADVVKGVAATFFYLAWLGMISASLPPFPETVQGASDSNNGPAIQFP